MRVGIREAGVMFEGMIVCLSEYGMMLWVADEGKGV